MSGVALVALVVLCFAGGYILVNSLFAAFEKKPQPTAPQPQPLAVVPAEHFRAILGLRFGATTEELEEAYQRQREKYSALTTTEVDAEIRDVARRKLEEIEEAYTYFQRNPARR